MNGLRARSRFTLLAILALMLLSALVVAAPRFSAAGAAAPLTCDDEEEDEEGTGELPEEMHQLAPDLTIAEEPLPQSPGIVFRWRRLWIDPNSQLSADSPNFRYVVIVTEGTLRGLMCFKDPDDGWARIYRASGSIKNLEEGDRFSLQAGDVAEFEAAGYNFVTGKGPTYLITTGNNFEGESPCPGTRCFTPPFIDLQGLLRLGP